MKTLCSVDLLFIHIWPAAYFFYNGNLLSEYSGLGKSTPSIRKATLLYGQVAKDVFTCTAMIETILVWHECI